ncbi:DUF3152 domain-containing protein [Streptomyces sp. NPDC048106]|uniref:DUF3152 domain-containing protein n=1 Tax=Streptomyces sp. NPDC048106 TaxID=3155750 RepID=UPI003455EBE2
MAAKSERGAPGRDVPGLPEGAPGGGAPGRPAGASGGGAPGRPAGASGGGAPGRPAGAPGRGVPRAPDGTPARGVPRAPDGTPARGVPRLPDGTPARGVPRLPDGTPARGVPRPAGGTPAHGVPGGPGGAAARGGHPEQREPGGGWGEFPGRPGSDTGAHQVVLPRQRQPGPGAGPGGAAVRGPRQDYLDAFDHGRDGGGGPGGARTKERPAEDPEREPEPEAEESGADKASLPAQRGGKGRAFTGIAAAAVTTVLAVVVAGQVTEGRDGGAEPGRAVPDQGAGVGARPSVKPSAVPLTYEQKMDRTYPLSATLKASGKFDTVPGTDKAPGTGRKYRYRVDIEQGLGLDGALFAAAVQKTLNDDRSWGHGGTRTFERVSSGTPDFVITLASPGTTATWCAKSGLDTTEDNVSCDSAATQRVMINAYRWAQGSKTYGDKIHMYRQMLINHEVGHRLGHNHVTCEKDGELAPVMQQQTKFLDHDGIHCLPNAWPYPRS